MNVSDVAFERPSDPPDPSYVLRVRIRGTGLIRSGPVLVAEVGGVPVLDLIAEFEVDGVTGFLADEPATGAAVSVGFLGKELVDTGHAYQPPIV